MSVRPRIICSGKGIKFPGALASGWQSLVAFAQDTCISLVEPNTTTVVQSLNLHADPVTKLVWAPENYYHDSKNPYIHRLASADSSGRIIIWNVVLATPLAEASERDSGVYDMYWVFDQDVSRDLLLVLHTGNKLILWNAQTCTPLWKKTYSCSIKTISSDPFSSQNIILHGSNHFILVDDLSWNSFPGTSGRQFLMSDSGRSNEPTALDSAPKRFSQTIKETAKAVIGKGFFRSLNSHKKDGRFLSDDSNNGIETPLQIVYHGFRKQHAIFVYAREIVFFDLVLSQHVGDIRLDQSSASFVQVYSCRQADVLICLHQNGTISVHGCLQAYTPPLDEEAFAQSPSDLTYNFLCESKSLRRGRNFNVVAMSVNPSSELSITVTTSDGRLQFFSIVSVAPSQDDWPQWTLMDTMKALNPEKSKSGSSLRIRFVGFYKGGSPFPTVCCACPAHFLLPLAAKIKHESLIAVGTARGSVQIWDLHTTKMWREYLLVNGPVCGIAWGISDEAEIGGAESGCLTLFAYSCQTVEGGSGASGNGTTQDLTKPATFFRNTVVRVDLETGAQQSVLTQNADVKELRLLKQAMQKSSSSIKPNKWFTIASETADLAAANATPIRSLKVSNLGQYLAIFYENWPLEIWDARKLVLLKCFSRNNCIPVALTWSNVNLSSHASSIQSSFTGLKQSPSGDSKAGNLYVRETFILCTSPLSLQLFTMEGSDMDTMPISNTIVQSLPMFSRNSITCASWRSPMIAFGMADGCVAVRNLQTKETLTRSMAVLVSDSEFVDNPSAVSSDAVPLSNVFKGEIIGANGKVSAPSYVKKVEFLFSGGSPCRLLALCNGGIAVWEPRKMVLLCAARFGTSLPKILIDSTWTNAATSSADSASTCSLLALDGSLRLAATGSASANQALFDDREVVQQRQDSAIEVSDEYFPISQFQFNSSLSTDVDNSDFLYLPSLLPTNVALTIRHLLQHQPWRPPSCSREVVQEAGAGVGSAIESSFSKIALACPSLGTNFAHVQSSVNRFFTKFQSMKHLCSPFESSHLSIAERCLLTAELFGDTYETVFWRVAAYRLLTTAAEKGTASAQCRLRRFRLTDLFWDELTEKAIYRAAVFERANRLVHDTTSEHSKLGTHFLLLLGFKNEAIKRLVEDPMDSASFSFNIHRACLLASQGYICSLEAAVADSKSEELSAARLNYTSSVKLLTANLISNNHLYEGVEMLCILGMHLEACRYLETYNEWGTAVWLAKCMMNKDECDGVMRRWATYLASTANRKTLAILVLVYLGQHTAVLSLLQSLQQHQLAARYLEACLECQALATDVETEKLCSQVFLEFAQTLTRIGQREQALYYAGLAGDIGKSLHDEIDFLLN